MGAGDPGHSRNSAIGILKIKNIITGMIHVFSPPPTKSCQALSLLTPQRPPYPISFSMERGVKMINNNLVMNMTIFELGISVDQCD